MSHLARIIAVKKSLIEMGVVNPITQIAVVRTAYVRALAIFQQSGRLTKDQHGEFFNQILGYWNETSPVQGNLVIAELRRFNAEVTASMLALGSIDSINIVITPIAEDIGEVKISEIAGYSDLVGTLVAEAQEQLTGWLKAGYYCASTEV